ncbi:hypothetical protein ADJ73_11015 [Arsenicicoccus sp. oral taxon 190]|nr:hypothetical protein ADJ73_11015 [Arsenicicoccus sp. oral taxon 190]
MVPSGLAALVAAGFGVGVGAASARGAHDGLSRRPPGGSQRWHRTNHAGRTVSLLEGPAWALGAAAPLALASLTAPAGRRAVPAAAAAAVLAAAAVGAVDDHAGATSVKGLRGHLQALRQGTVTTGVLKIVGLAGVGLGTATVIDRSRPRAGGVAAVASTLLGGAVIAGAANLLNLFDLRPGRALKVVLLSAPLTAAGAGDDLRGADAVRCAAAAAGASLALLPTDLAGDSMLGDTGANAAGALLGTALVARGGTRTRAVALGILSGLILASERVSFTQVIADTPWLDALDRWGRAT